MNVLLFLIVFFFMEFIAWFMHKYVMHGFLWMLHEDHHTKVNTHKIVERNDSFFLIFATPGITMIALGTLFHISYCLPIGLGITAYGFCYFIIHDIFIHQRIKWFRNSENSYLLAIRKAHKMHHKHLTKENGECFGMLVVPFKYYRDSSLQKK